MSSYATSSSVVGSTRFCLIRAPVLLEIWWKRTDFGEVALYSFTGTLTSPKLIAPLQIARAIAMCIADGPVGAKVRAPACRRACQATRRAEPPFVHSLGPRGRGQPGRLRRGDRPCVGGVAPQA